jgi:hypothetical protein
MRHATFKLSFEFLVLSFELSPTRRRYLDVKMGTRARQRYVAEAGKEGWVEAGHWATRG